MPDELRTVSAAVPRPAEKVARVLIPVLAVLSLLPQVPAALALVLGIAAALTVGNPWAERTRPLAHKLLAWSVIGLGAGMDLRVVGRVGLHGLGYTAIGISVALGIGTWLGRRLKTQRDVSLLLCVGTAICGGSAIAAVTPAIRARSQDASVALATVFLLNAVALVIFPPLGHLLGMSEGAFGLWSALAIHDTSSVVGAAAQYGGKALQIATATKLARALWIVPVTFGVALVRARTAGPGEAGRGKPKLPWFIAGFIGAAAVVTFLPALQPAGHLVSVGAQRLLAATLFLIGLGLSRSALREIGVRPLIQAVLLWLLLASGTLLAIFRGWIS